MARRKYRIYLLNHFIFGKEIEKVDKTFLLRLNESNLVLEDKSRENGTKYPLFLNKKEEKEYYHKYPTIYHLRKAQINNEPDSFKDIRYLYLSVHHIIKKRGNFLSEGDFNPDSPLTNEMLDLANNVISNLLKDYFELQGYEVITAGGGTEALARISCDPDMIILDINMPDLDGLSVCRKIREKVKSNTPIQKNALSGGAGARRFLLWVITHRVQDSWTRHFYFFGSFCFFLRFIRYTLQKAFRSILLPCFTERNYTCFTTDHRTGSFMTKNIRTG